MDMTEESVNLTAGEQEPPGLSKREGPGGQVEPQRPEEQQVWALFAESPRRTECSAAKITGETPQIFQKTKMHRFTKFSRLRTANPEDVSADGTNR